MLKHFTESRIEKFVKWINNANEARAKGLLDSKMNQYDKAEEIITFYTFAPLELRENQKKLIENILILAEVKENVLGSVSLDFESQFKPPTGYLEWLNDEVNQHQIRYIRTLGRDNVKRGRRLEGNTHVDVVVESDNLLILIEVKFTSDIAHEIFFNPNRNQLARTIDVGISAAKKKGKKLVVLLCTPSEFYNKKSRLYYYKIQEYGDFNKMSEDIPWRPLKEIKEQLLKVAWIPLEEVIEIIYKNLNSPEIGQAKEFFAERKLQTKELKS
jgi:hypothetical protein